mmetsp:Transcript_9459/g.22381  ORF Transcript_9459/g.22381 Transcript_9459/m.22381 type:complete len:98 (+) Transcript_9459:60-353(+)
MPRTDKVILSTTYETFIINLNNIKMKFSVALLVLGLTSVSAFAPSASFGPKTSLTQVNAEPEEEEGLDLNLEEMFDMFDAADKDEKFDDAVKKIKSD